MKDEINPWASTATSCSEGETKYVLEDVFWVPVSNCRARHFAPPGHVELHTKKPDIGEVSSLNKSETLAASAIASLVQGSVILRRVHARFAQTSGKRRSAVSDGGKH